jgi:hypothetical protein
METENNRRTAECGTYQCCSSFCSRSLLLHPEENGYSKRNYFLNLEVIIYCKLKEIITISKGYHVLTGRRRKAEKPIFFFFL